MKLKTDGNYLVSSSKHGEAVEKYTRYALTSHALATSWACRRPPSWAAARWRGFHEWGVIRRA